MASRSPAKPRTVIGRFVATAVAVALAAAFAGEAAAGELADQIRAEIDRELAAAGTDVESGGQTAAEALGDRIRADVEAELKATRVDLRRVTAAATVAAGNEVERAVMQLEDETTSVNASVGAAATRSRRAKRRPHPRGATDARERRAPLPPRSPPPVLPAAPVLVAPRPRADSPAPRRRQVRASPPARRNSTRTPARTPTPADASTRAALALLQGPAGGGWPTLVALLAPFFLLVPRPLRRIAVPGSPRPPPGAVPSFWRPG